jgi:ABC-type glycerol-3-phosphate transport system substrate-binding protein
VPTFKVGDIVRIIRQPRRQPWIQLTGEIAYIEELQGEGVVYIHTLHLDGHLGGMGSVDTDDLEHYNDERYRAELERRRIEFRELEREILIRSGMEPPPSLKMSRLDIICEE